MMFRALLRSGGVFAVLAVMGMQTSPASAAPSMGLLLPQAVAIAGLSVSANASCLTYVYDRNGNRLQLQSSASGAVGMVWGSSAFGCSLWSQ